MLTDVAVRKARPSERLGKVARRWWGCNSGSRPPAANFGISPTALEGDRRNWPSVPTERRRRVSRSKRRELRRNEAKALLRQGNRPVRSQTACEGRASRISRQHVRDGGRRIARPGRSGTAWRPSPPARSNGCLARPKRPSDLSRLASITAGGSPARASTARSRGQAGKRQGDCGLSSVRCSVLR